MTDTIEKQGQTDETGVVFVANLFGWGALSNQDITAEKLYHLRSSVHGESMVAKLVNLVFPEDPVIEAFDKDGNPAPELESMLTTMYDAAEVDIASKMRIAFIDRCWFGAGIFNWVWKRDGAYLNLTKLTRLQPHSFDTLPQGHSIVWSPILQGIVVNKGGVVEFHQRQGSAPMPVKLDERAIVMITDPTDGEIAGSPIMRPVAPVLEMLNFTYNAMMQWVNRLSVPPLFIKIINPQPASPRTDGISDVDYANTVLQHYGKDNQYPLRENMELIWPDARESSQSVVEIIKHLISVLVDYTSPSSQISKGGTLISGSSEAESNLHQSYIRGHHRWIEAGFNRINDVWMDANGWTAKGYTAHFRIPEPSTDRSELKLQQARELRLGGTILRNEHRALCDHDSLEDTELDEAAEYWRVQAPASASVQGGPMAQKMQTGEAVYGHHARISRTAYEDMQRALHVLEHGVMEVVDTVA